MKNAKNSNHQRNNVCKQADRYNKRTAKGRPDAEYFGADIRIDSDARVSAKASRRSGSATATTGPYGIRTDSRHSTSSSNVTSRTGRRHGTSASNAAAHAGSRTDGRYGNISGAAAHTGRQPRSDASSALLFRFMLLCFAALLCITLVLWLRHGQQATATDAEKTAKAANPAQSGQTAQILQDGQAIAISDDALLSVNYLYTLENGSLMCLADGRELRLSLCELALPEKDSELKALTSALQSWLSAPAVLYLQLPDGTRPALDALSSQADTAVYVWLEKPDSSARLADQSLQGRILGEHLARLQKDSGGIYHKLLTKIK